MVADMQRFEDAARVAMGDYSLPSGPAPVRASLLEGLAANTAKIFAMLGRTAGRPAV